MRFDKVINAKLSLETDRPMMKKDPYPVSDNLKNYLNNYGRDVNLSIVYKDLLNYRYANSLKDKKGKTTHWETAIYDLKEMEFLKDALIETYAILKTEGDMRYIKHLDVDRIDFCEFGNSVPFRIRIINKINDNYDYFYVKHADASRIYGLELEHILSPNSLTFFYHKNTLIEEHIAGIPGDVFLKDQLEQPNTNKIRIAKEFVKFNERCFARLLGDMRSYNFVLDITPDVEDYQYRIRAIDFDQQCYEGKLNLYLPQFYKENFDYVEMVLKNLSTDVIEQYRTEERTSMAYRVVSNRKKLMDLLNIMMKDELSENYKVKMLRSELDAYHNTTYFAKCSSMGAIVKRQLKFLLLKHLKNIQHKK